MKGLALIIALCLSFGAVPVQARSQVRPVVSVTAGRSLTPDCMAEAAKEYGVPFAVLVGILATEGGTVGEAVRNTNGSFDLGPFQVNTCNLNALADQGFTPEELLRDGCVNARAAAWILRQEYERTGAIWSAIGAYHSRTPERSAAYIARVKMQLARMAGEMKGGQRPEGVRHEP